MKKHAALVLILGLGLAFDAEGRPYDPSLTFSTLETPHFLVHFHEQEEALAREAARLAEAAHAKLVPLLGHTPREKTHVILVDVDDSANGWAIALPYNTIELRAASPDARSALHQADDWLWNLIVHEYTHILHTDAIGGPSRVFNTLFGKALSPNAAWPRWFLEGLAVWTESELSTGGRLRSSLYDLQLRTHLLEDEALSLQELTHLPLSYPRLGTRYLYGGRFIDFIARRHGTDALANIIGSNGRSWIPYFLDLIAGWHTGESFDAMYDAWLLEETARARAMVADTRDTEERLTFRGEIRRTPRFSPDGRRLWSLVLDADQRPGLWAFDLDTGEETRVRDLNGDGALAVLPDGRVLMSQPEITGNFRAYDDLFLYDPGPGKLKRLTRGARLSEPDVAKDGRIVSVHRPGPIRTRLVTFTSIDGVDRASVLYEGKSTVASPRWSPDGQTIVFLEERHGAFDLRLIDVESRQTRWLTDDASQDLTPAFDELGRVVFASDRTGIFDLYTLDPETGIVRRHTRVKGGAFEPLWTDGGLYFVRSGAKGMDLARVGELLDEAAPAAHAIVDEPLHGEDDPTWQIRPYEALPTLYPTRRLPLLGSEPGGYTLGLQLSGADVLGKWQWGFSGWLGLESKQPGFDAWLRTDADFPALTLEGSRYVAFAPGGGGATEVVTDASLSASWSLQRWNSGARIDLGWRFTWLTPRSTDPRLEAGRLSMPFVTLSWSSAWRYTHSISNEEGRRFSLSVDGGGPMTGSDLMLLRTAGIWQEYVRLPAHHVLALQVSGGWSVSQLGGRTSFALGGMPLLPSTGALVSLQSPNRVLRGYPVASDGGPVFVLGNLEWRLPLVTTEFGVSTWPVQLRRLHAAVFADAGDAYDPATEALSLRYSAGAELRSEWVLGYTLTTEIRLGWARGLSSGGVNQFWVGLGRGF